MLAFFANTKHYIDHLESIYKAVDTPKAFIIPNSLKNYGQSKGLTDLIIFKSNSEFKSIFKRMYRKNKRNIKWVVVSYGNAKVVGQVAEYVILLEHGAGQSYKSKTASWARGKSSLIKNVQLFLATNQHCHEAFISHNKGIKSEIVGCPKLDRYLEESKPYDKKEPKICFSWHWESRDVPETRGSFFYWRDKVAELAENYKIAIHGHPRIQNQTKRFAKLNGIEFIPDFEDVIKTCDIYVCDNSSTLFEFAAMDKPVVVLNPPWYRKEVEHGLRFWEYADIGVQCDSPDMIAECIDKATRDHWMIRKRRNEHTEKIYPHLGGSVALIVKKLAEINKGR
jgi:ADP-heptose:LPS heptosyltransferase